METEVYENYRPRILPADNLTWTISGWKWLVVSMIFTVWTVASVAIGVITGVIVKTKLDLAEQELQMRLLNQQTIAYTPAPIHKQNKKK